MWLSLALVGGIAVGTLGFAPAPIQWVPGVQPGKHFFVAPKGFADKPFPRSKVLPAKLAVIDQPSSWSAREVPRFTAKVDNTIRWYGQDLCIEASGDKAGNAILVNHCTGKENQKWIFMPWRGEQKFQIKLKDTNQCIDVEDDKHGVLNGSPVELHACEGTVTEAWQLEEPSPHPAKEEGPENSFHSAAASLMAAVGALSLGTFLWHKRRNARVLDVNQKDMSAPLSSQGMVPAVMAVGPMPNDKTGDDLTVVVKVAHDEGVQHSSGHRNGIRSRLRGLSTSVRSAAPFMLAGGAVARKKRVPTTMMAVTPHPVPTIEAFLSDVALVTPPPALPSLVGLLVSRGEEVLTPGADATLHPLLVPLTRRPEDGVVTGLLRWSTAGSGSKLPVVRTYGCGRQLEVLADCTEHFLAKAAVDADADGSATAADLAKLAEDAIGLSYEAGTADASPGGVPGYLITKVGPFMTAYQQLALKHAESGSEISALVACERCKSVFPSWGQAHAFHSRMLTRFMAHEEARDVARAAIRLPLWTLGDDLGELCELAQTTPAELVASLRDQADGKLSPEKLRAQNGTDKRTPKEIAMDRASYLLDLVVAAPDDYSWESVRAELASLVSDAELAASLVRRTPGASSIDALLSG